MAGFADRLKECRLEKGLTQIELAKYLNIPTYPNRNGESETSNVYGRYERGTYEPKVNVIQKMCTVLNVSADYLLGLSDQRDGIKMIQTSIQDFSTDELLAELKRRWNDYGR